ncbi:velvet factor [Mucidula mucida]|nr:velvet factor [Mucidula mucida]
MVVSNEDGTFVDEKDVDCSFFLVTVDLWSADGKQEMNLVLHPSSSDRYIPQNPPKSTSGSSSSGSSRRRGTSTSQQRSSTGQQTPVSRRTPTPSHSRPGETPNPETTSPMSPNQSYSYPPPTPSDGVSLTPISYGAPPPAEAPTWGYSAAERNNAFPPSLPSIQTFGRANSEAWQQNEGNSEMAPYRPWTAEPGYYNNTSPTDNREMSWPPQGPPTYSRETSEESATFAPTYMPASNQSTKSSSVIPPLPRHTYTRTLVGPLSANATVLQDEHRKPGIFFLFQDLSVRTEGGGFGIMFPFHRSDQSQRYLPSANASHECRRPSCSRLWCSSVNTEASPVLAQTFTEPFTVYSAKRFPGVPDTTALSIAFGNQGQKLPLRNRHGSGKRQRRDNDGSDDDSDGD